MYQPVASVFFALWKKMQPQELGARAAGVGMWGLGRGENGGGILQLQGSKSY